jgi:hypothetical protein
VPPVIPAISAVSSRIQRIEQQFGVERRTTMTTVQSSVPFDPFGEAYQQALEQRPVVPTPTPIPTPSARSFEAGRPEYLPGTVRLSVSPSTADASPNGPASTGVIGGYGRMPVPESLAPFGNGNIPSDELTPIRQNGHRLYAPAAAAWDRMVDAAAADGLELRITDSYRSFENQVDLVRRKGLYSQGGLAAQPGTSNHGWGLAVDADVTDPAMLTWIRQHGHEFGWVEAAPREPWHWEYRPEQA